MAGGDEGLVGVSLVTDPAEDGRGVSAAGEGSWRAAGEGSWGAAGEQGGGPRFMGEGRCRVGHLQLRQFIFFTDPQVSDLGLVRGQLHPLKQVLNIITTGCNEIYLDKRSTRSHRSEIVGSMTKS